MIRDILFIICEYIHLFGFFCFSPLVDLKAFLRFSLAILFFFMFKVPFVDLMGYNNFIDKNSIEIVFIHLLDRNYLDFMKEGRRMIEFKNVEKYYGKFHALKNINIKFDEGELVTIIGPSGSGKSTLLRCINGLESITEGELLILGENIADPNTDIRQVRQEMGMVFQHFELYPHLTVLENVTLAPIKVRGLAKAEAEAEAEKFLTRVNMWDRKDSKPGQLSGGQQQRVAIARGLAMRPKAMLFDEPTSALDPETIGDVLDVMKDIAEKDKMTMIVVTHEMGFAREVADRTVFMKDGEILEDRESEAFFTSPNDPNAKRFIEQVFAY